MALFDFLNRKKVGPHRDLSSDGVLGRENELDMIDDEVPSVNRRKGKNKVTEMIGFAAILAAGITMLYVIGAEENPQVEKPKVEKPQIKNSLPPLVMPPPPVEMIVPPVEKPQNPIPLQSLNQVSPQPNKPALPDWVDRKMTGGLVLTAAEVKTNSDSAVQAKLSEGSTNEDAPDTNPLALKLKPTVSKGSRANLLPNRDYLITKGTALDCALETAVDSTVPGITTCRLTRDVYSDNGHVVLLDRGSQLVGEYQGGLTHGQARIFVLWTRAKTPNGVIVTLDSPGTDALGRSGHNGFVDRHFTERFGAAILLSLVKDGISIARNNNTSPVTIGGGGSDQLATEVLKNTVNIPPTLYINQGEHIQVMVARDLDFSTVYGLELKE